MIYALVNEKTRIKFEKKYHIPYGYGNTVISSDLQWLMKVLNNIHISIRQDHIIEKIECGVPEIIYPEDRKLYYVEVDSANA